MIFSYYFTIIVFKSFTKWLLFNPKLTEFTVVHNNIRNTIKKIIPILASLYPGKLSYLFLLHFLCQIAIQSLLPQVHNHL